MNGSHISSVLLKLCNFNYQKCAKKPHGGSSLHRSQPPKKKGTEQKHSNTNQRKTELSPTQAFVPILHWKVELYLTLGIWRHFEFWGFCVFFRWKKKVLGKVGFLFLADIFSFGSFGKGPIFWGKNGHKIRIQCQCYSYLLLFLVGWNIYHVWGKITKLRNNMISSSDVSMWPIYGWGNFQKYWKTVSNRISFHMQGEKRALEKETIYKPQLFWVRHGFLRCWRELISSHPKQNHLSLCCSPLPANSSDHLGIKRNHHTNVFCKWYRIDTFYLRLLCTEKLQMKYILLLEQHSKQTMKWHSAGHTDWFLHTDPYNGYR